MNQTFIERVTNLAVEIQQIPSPTFHETRRAEFVVRYFSNLGLEEPFIDECGNVYACLKGRGEKPPVVVTAHLDTVFPEGTDLTGTRTIEKITGPGIGDNSLGLAGLFGLYWALNEARPDDRKAIALPGDVWLVANVGEEGLGDLKGMKSVVDRFKGDVLAYIILEGMSLGQIYHRGLGVRRYEISVNTKGGHSWIDYGNPSAIHELADIVVKLKNLTLPIEPRTTLNVGVLSGGTSVNTIAAKARMELDLRSVSSLQLGDLISQVGALVEQANHTGGKAIQVEAKIIGDRPAGEIPAEHPLVVLARECHIVNGIDTRLNIGSTDANEPLSRGFPAICMGLTTGGGSHTTSEFVDIKPIGQGLQILVDLVRVVLQRCN
jgi:acetylornithine deacetylase/succinyl-diaminopimelate desuccinylase-like protein